MNNVRITNAVVMDCGQEPDSSPGPVDDVVTLNWWQNKAYVELCESALRNIISPTGSGKAVCMMSLAIHDLVVNKSRVVIMAVPKIETFSPFSTRKINLMGEVRTWCAGVVLNDGKDTVNRLKTVLSMERGTQASKIVLTTHATFVRLLKKVGER